MKEQKILALKKELLIMRIKKSSKKYSTKDYKEKKKEVAKILTSLNNKKI
jgi:ribosomal protein L29